MLIFKTLTDEKTEEVYKCRLYADRAGRLICLFFGILICYSIFDYLMTDDSSTNRLAFHEFYDQEEIDVAVVGASKIYHGFNSVLADEILEESTFNLGTVSQPTSVTYYRVKELLEKYDVNTLFVDVEFSGLSRELEGGQATWIVTDYMRGLNSLELALAHGNFKTKWATLSSVYRNRGNFSTEYLKNNYIAKHSYEYKNYLPENTIYSGYKLYRGKGFVEGIKENIGYDFFCYPEDYSEFDEVCTPNHVSMDYLSKIVELCRNSNTRLVLITMPESRLYLRKLENYTYFQSYIQDFCEENKIEYYNLNLLTEIEWEEKDFMNLDHLTLDGADKVTKILCEIYNGKVGSYYAGLESILENGIIGILYNVEEMNNGKLNLSWNIIKGNDLNSLSFQYKINVLDEERRKKYESEIFSESSIELEKENTDMITIEIYDDSQYIGDALFQNL